MRWLLMGISCITMLVSLPAPAAAEETVGSEKAAVEAVEALLADIRAFRSAPEGENLSQEDRTANAEITKRIHGRLDIDGLARRSLMATWDEIGADEQKAFRDLLLELFAGVAYPKSASFLKDLDAELLGTSSDDDERIVSMELEHPDEGLIEIDFHLAELEGAWRVVEIDLDGASLALDIRAQMQKIIKEDSYAELKRRMREKLETEGQGG